MRLLDFDPSPYAVFAVSLGSPTFASLLGMAKAAIHFAAIEVSRKTVVGDGFREIRKCLLGQATRLPTGTCWDFDTPDMTSTPFYHGIEVTACPQTACVSARVHLFGAIRVRFLLSTTYSGKRHVRRRFTRDPSTGVQEKCSLSCEHPLPWLLNLSQSTAGAFAAGRSYYEEHAPSRLTNLRHHGRAETVAEEDALVRSLREVDWHDRP